MPDDRNSNVLTADALTLLWRSQLALGAAIEEITLWLSANGAGAVADNALSAMETLDKNAQAITVAINMLRRS